MDRLEIDEFVKEVVEKFQTDVNYREILKSKVDTIRIVNALVFSDTDAVCEKLAKAKDMKQKHIIVPGEAVVGYNIENLGDEDIVISSSKWIENGDGTYVAEPTEIIIRTGEIASLTKRDFFMLTIKPEYSNEFANGSVTTRLSIHNMANIKFDDIINLMEIALRVDGDGKVSGIDFDTFVIHISSQTTYGRWTVKPEYVDMFGFLNNNK